MKNLLQLVSTANDVVVVRLNPELTVLDHALNPWLPEAQYVSVTRGRNHIMTFIYEDGSKWSIEWGDNGCTLLADSLRETRNKIVDFIQKECGIMLDLYENSIPVEAWIYFDGFCECYRVSVYDQNKNLGYMQFGFKEQYKPFDTMVKCLKQEDVIWECVGYYGDQYPNRWKWVLL